MPILCHLAVRHIPGARLVRDYRRKNFSQKDEFLDYYRLDIGLNRAYLTKICCYYIIL